MMAWTRVVALMIERSGQRKDISEAVLIRIGNCQEVERGRRSEGCCD